VKKKTDRFYFISLQLNRTQTEKNQKKTEQKTEPNRKKPSQISLNRFFPNITEPKPVGFGFFFLKKTGFGYFFLIKPNRTENDHP